MMNSMGGGDDQPDQDGDVRCFPPIFLNTFCLTMKKKMSNLCFFSQDDSADSDDESEY